MDQDRDIRKELQTSGDRILSLIEQSGADPALLAMALALRGFLRSMPYETVEAFMLLGLREVEKYAPTVAAYQQGVRAAKADRLPRNQRRGTPR